MIKRTQIVAAVFTSLIGTGLVCAQTNNPLRIATWNVAWLANEPIATLDLAKECDKQDQSKVDFKDRTPGQCQKGAPFRMAGSYAQLARNAKLFDFDIIGFQEVEGKPALDLLLGNKALPSGNQSGMIPPGTYQVEVNPEGGWQKVGIAVKAQLLAPGKSLTATPFTPLGAPLTRDKRSGLDVTIPLRSGDLRVLVVHLKSACQRSPLDSKGTNAEDCSTLAKQAPILQSWIKDRQKEGKPFMVIGDYNRVLAPIEQHESCASGSACQNSSLGSWLDSNELIRAPIMVPTATLEHVDGCFSKSHGKFSIDHVLVGGGAESGFVSGSQTSHPYVDMRTGQPIQDKRKTRLYSDHCPVSITWKP